MSQQNLNKVYGHVKVREVLIGPVSKTLTKFDSGKVFAVDGNLGAVNIILPLAGESDLVGWECDFILLDTNPGPIKFLSSDNCSADPGKGQVMSGIIVADTAAAQTTVTLTAGIITTPGADAVVIGTGASTGGGVAKLTLTCHTVDPLLGTGFHVTGVVAA